MISITLTRDDVSAKLAALNDPELMRRATLAAGTVIMGLAQRAFDEPSLRPHSWPARKKPAKHPLLLKSGTLRQSIFVRQEGSDSVRVGTPVKYGAHHQLGSAKSAGRGSGVPERPYFPIVEGLLTGQAQSDIEDAMDALIGAAGN